MIILLIILQNNNLFVIKTNDCTKNKKIARKDIDFYNIHYTQSNKL